jgi:hypothetical protein
MLLTIVRTRHTSATHGQADEHRPVDPQAVQALAQVAYGRGHAARLARRGRLAVPAGVDVDHVELLGQGRALVAARIV